MNAPTGLNLEAAVEVVQDACIVSENLPEGEPKIAQQFTVGSRLAIIPQVP